MCMLSMAVFIRHSRVNSNNDGCTTQLDFKEMDIAYVVVMHNSKLCKYVYTAKGWGV